MGAGASIPEISNIVGPSQSSPSCAESKFTSLNCDGLKTDGSILLIHELLKDVRFAHHFKTYITTTYRDDIRKASIANIDNYDKVALEASDAVAKRMATLAYNYFQFYLDVTDFEKFTDSTLKIMRADAIFQTYLAATAKHKMQIPRNLIETIMQRLDSEQLPPSDTFQNVKQMAQEYLTSEVYTFYVQNQGPSGYKAGAYNLAITKLRQNFRKPSKEEASLLDSVLLDPAKTAILKDYLTQVDSSDLLFVFLELLDIKQMMAAVLSVSKGEQQNAGNEESVYTVGRQFVLARINRLYHRHLRVGSTFRDIIPPDEVYEALTLTPAAIDLLVGNVFDILSDKFIDFLKKAKASGVVKKLDEARAERQKEVEAYAKQYEKNLSAEDVQKMPLKGIGSPRTERGLQALEQEARDLLNVLSCNKDMEKSFILHLAKVKRANLVFFWRNVEDFKSIPVTQKNFIQGRAEKLFDKYCKRGAVSEISLTLTVRTDILTKIFRADINIFDSALKDVITILLPEYIVWQVKRSQPTFANELKDLDFFDELKVKPAVDDRRNKALPISFLELLTTPSCCNIFKKFVEAEFCVPTLLLWGDIQEWKELPPSNSLVETRYRKIYNKYIKKDSNTPVYVSNNAKHEADLCIMNERRPFSFDLIESEVFQFMRTVLLPKFLESEHYLLLLETLRRDVRDDALLGKGGDGASSLFASGNKADKAISSKSQGNATSLCRSSSAFARGERGRVSSKLSSQASGDGKGSTSRPRSLRRSSTDRGDRRGSSNKVQSLSSSSSFKRLSGALESKFHQRHTARAQEVPG